MKKQLLVVLSMLALLSSINANAAGLDLSALTSGNALGSKIGVSQLQSIIASQKVYCAKIESRNYLASVGALAVFKQVVTSKTRSVTCNSTVKRQALSRGIEVIQLSKSKFTGAAYARFGKALTKAFGVN